MSQYPYSPYQQPSPAYYNPNVQRLYAPARRAAILMFVVAGFMGMCGMCLGVAVKIGPMEQVVATNGAAADELAKLGFSPVEFVRFMYVVMAALSILTAILFWVLGMFVRKGTMAPAVTSLILVILIGLFMMLQLVGGIVQMLSQQNPIMGIPVLIIGGFVLLLVWLSVSLIGAIKSAAALRDANAQYAQYYWQMQQQAYQQGAYAGYGYSPAPPPPPAMMPAPQPPAMMPAPPPPPPDASTRGHDESLRP